MRFFKFVCLSLVLPAMFLAGCGREVVRPAEMEVQRVVISAGWPEQVEKIYDFSVDRTEAVTRHLLEKANYYLAQREGDTDETLLMTYLINVLDAFIMAQANTENIVKITISIRRGDGSEAVLPAFFFGGVDDQDGIIAFVRRHHEQESIAVIEFLSANLREGDYISFGEVLPVPLIINLVDDEIYIGDGVHSMAEELYK